MLRFDQITKADLDAAHDDTYTTEGACAELGVTQAEYKELCYIYDVIPRDEWSVVVKHHGGPLVGADPKGGMPQAIDAITQEELISVFNRSRSTRQAALTLGISISQLTTLAARHGLALPKFKKNSFTHDQIAQVLADNQTLEQAALALGVTVKSFVYWADKHGLYQRKRNIKVKNRKY